MRFSPRRSWPRGYWQIGNWPETTSTSGQRIVKGIIGSTSPGWWGQRHTSWRIFFITRNGWPQRPRRSFFTMTSTSQTETLIKRSICLKWNSRERGMIFFPTDSRLSFFFTKIWVWKVDLCRYILSLSFLVKKNKSTTLTL